MIEIRGLTKRYDRVEALKGIDIDVAPGELFGFLGPNGAGKTTTMQILAGLLTPTAGSVKIAGIDLATDPRGVKQRIGYLPDRPYIYEKLTGRELLRLFADLWGVPAQQARTRAGDMLDLFGLTHQGDELTEGYSHGMKQRICLAATLMHDPDLLIIDEPMVGLDPQGARLFKDLMRQRCAAGKTVLMSTHTLQVAAETCDRVGIIHRGEIAGVGTVAELRSRYTREGADLEEIFLTMTGGAVA